MGTRGPLPKAPTKAQGHRDHSLVVLPNPGTAVVKVPRPPQGLSPKLRRAWRRYWESPVAQVVTDIDMEVVSRLFEHYRQYDRAVAALGTAMFVTVSPNQVKANPALDAVLKLDTAILRLENELGKTPMARARLGIAVGEAVMTAAELNRIAKESDARDDDEDTKLLEEFQPD